MDFKLALAVATLVGGIVGVGFFSIPYVVSQVGFWPGIFYLVVLAAVFLFLHLLFGEVILRTKEEHRLPGYAEKYLGKRGKFFISIAAFTTPPMALICYIIAGGEFLSLLLGLDFLICAFVLWIFLSIMLFSGIKNISKFEFFMLILFVFTLAIIFFASLPNINLDNMKGFYSENLFLPYGVILFSMAGATSIPLLREILKGEEKKIKKAIILGTIIPVVFYIIFAFSVVGVSGKNTSQEAIEGLIEKLGNNIILIGAIFGVMTISTSFLTVGTYLRDVFFRDFNVRKKMATLAVCMVSALGLLLGKSYLIILAGLVGAILGVFEDIVLILISKKAKIKGNRMPEYEIKIPNILLIFLSFIFVVGLIREVIYFINR